MKSVDPWYGHMAGLIVRAHSERRLSLNIAIKYGHQSVNTFAHRTDYSEN